MQFLLILLTTLLPIQQDTIPEVVVVGSTKQTEMVRELPVASTTLSMYQLEQQGVAASKELSQIVPNLHMPDYGSQMTSSMYMRGMGARIDNPVMGLYIDNMPMMNKNGYDFDYFDIRRVEVLNGPQGTLYGRNTIGGVLNIYTLSPIDYQGTRVEVGYGNAETLTARASTYQKPSNKFAFSVGVHHYQTNGFFRNNYNHRLTDRRMSESARLRFQFVPSDRVFIDNITWFSYTNQQGYAYAPYNEVTDTREPINYNDPSSYYRLMVSNGTTVNYRTEHFVMSSVTSYSFLDDRMTLDQDFMPESYFTITQKQREHNVSEELIFKNANPEQNWQWVSGFFGFYKHNRMSAPVTFKQTGIDSLILGNANKGIQSIFPEAELQILEESFDIASNFVLPTWGAALFHQSNYSYKNWVFQAGLRLDYEQAMMRYSNYATMNYRFTLTMPEFKPLPTSMSGREQLSYFEVLPRVSAMYRFDQGNVYATIANGYKAGGFNTQIFSDILQNKMMNDLMGALGLNFGDTNDGLTASATTYKPEHSWNYEVGTHLSFWENRIQVDAALFYIDCRDQQMTVFPPGRGTGRMMSNAGRTRSIGTEIAGQLRYNAFFMTGSYGYTNATFVEYNNGREDFAGKYIPYAPQHTLFFSANYRFSIQKKWLDYVMVNAGVKGLGNIYWNEENSAKQPFYATLNAQVRLTKGYFSLTLWGKNLTNTDYNVFYFKSMGNAFVQEGKPIQFGGTINIIL